MKVLVADKIAEEGVKVLESQGIEALRVWDEPKDKLPELIKDCDAIIVRSATKVRKALIDAAPNLKAIGRAGVGLDNVDVDYAKDKGIKVVNTPAATTISVAEMTMTHILATTRPVVRGTVSIKDGRWDKKALKGYELYGKTLGVIGIGRIGSAVAERAQAFGMSILAYDAYIKSDRFEMVGLDELYRRSDVITVHTPLTPETRHMFNADVFAKMKDGAVIVNVARGGVIDEDALFDALSSGKLRMAALDVFETEPPTGSKLLGLDNFICTPHIGGQTYEGQTRAGVQVAENVISALKE